MRKTSGAISVTWGMAPPGRGMRAFYNAELGKELAQGRAPSFAKAQSGPTCARAEGAGNVGLDSRLDRNGNRIQDFLNDLLGLFCFFQGGGVEAAHGYAVGEDRDDQRLEVFRDAEGASVDEGHPPGRAVEHLRSAGRDT